MISSHTLYWMSLLIHDDIIVNSSVSERGVTFIPYHCGRRVSTSNSGALEHWSSAATSKSVSIILIGMALQLRHNGRDSVSNHQPHDCSLNRLFRRRSKKTLKLRVTGLCAENSPGTGEFPAQMASNAENVSILMTSSWIGKAPLWKARNIALENTSL